MLRAGKVGQRLLPERLRALVAGDRPLWRSVAEYSGFYAMGPAEQAMGVAWMAREASVRLVGARPGDEVRVVGHYDPGPYARAFRTNDNPLWLELDGHPFQELILSKGGAFELVARLPRAGAVLTLRTAHAFVPVVDLGGGDDIRELSLQIARIELGGRAVLDFARAGRPYAAGPEDPVGINVVGFLREPTGLGQLARQCVAACHEGGVPFVAVDVRDSRQPRPSLHPVNLIHVNADQIPSVCRFLPDVLRDRYNVGVWMWELAEFPEEWLSSFDFLDEIWASSRFIRDALADKSPLPVVHMPPAVGFDLRADLRRPDLGLPEGEFLFLVMYDMRSLQVRKNPEGAIDAFRRAFPVPGRARLVIKVNHGRDDPAALACLQQQLADVPGAILIDRTLTPDETHALEALCDAYVSLHRAEGWGFNLIESMYLGKVVIGTNWSGNVDFMDANNSCPVNYRLVPLTEAHGPYRAGQLWADPDLDQAAWYMRRCVEDEGWRRTLEGAARSTIRADYSHRAVAERYRRRLSLIARRL